MSIIYCQSLLSHTLRHDFILLEAGKSVTATAQINDIFAFTSDGTYNIRYNRPLQILPKNMELVR